MTKKMPKYRFYKFFDEWKLKPANFNLAELTPIAARFADYLGEYLVTQGYHSFAADGQALPTLLEADQKRIAFYYPKEIGEQQRIVQLLAKIDKRISYNEERLIIIRNLKDGYLQRLFPTYGGSQPKERLTGFSEPWREVNLSALFYESRQPVVPNEYYPAVKLQADMKLELTPIKDIDYRELAKFQKVEVNDYLYDGDDFLGGVRGLNLSQPCSVAKRYHVMRVNEGVDVHFIQALTATYNFLYSVQRFEQGGKVPVDNFRHVKCYVPTDVAEQKAIGEFFTNLCRQVKLQETKIQVLQDYKQAYLQKMFLVKKH